MTLRRRIRVIPGAAPGGPLAIRDDLNRRLVETGVQWLATGQGNTPDQLAARRWAEENGIPLVENRPPDVILLARDLCSSPFPMPWDSKDVWHDHGHRKTLNWRALVADWIRGLSAGREVMWLNTGNWDIQRRLAAESALTALGSDKPP